MAIKNAGRRAAKKADERGNNDGPEGPGEEEQLRRVREFLRRLEALLASVVEYPDNLIAGRHHQVLRDAWREVQPLFATIKVARRDFAALRAVGLTGSALLFELAIFEHARNDLLDCAPDLFARLDAPVPPPSKPPGLWKRIRRFFRGALQAGDVVLGSLGKIPVLGAPIEAIKQYKEAVEAGVEVADAAVENDSAA
jgi:hypothetical protein